jgi:hypothetical protein
MKTERTKQYMERLVANRPALKVNQQRVCKEHLSFSGANGRMYVHPLSGTGYHLSLSGKSVEQQLLAQITALFGRHIGYKQTKPEPNNPYWWIATLDDVRKAFEVYQGTISLQKLTTLYYLKVSDGDHVAYKIGITAGTVAERFASDLHKIEVIKEWFFNAAEAQSREQKILTQYRDHQWSGPDLLEAGNTELFSIDVLEMDDTSE